MKVFSGVLVTALVLLGSSLYGQIGRRFPSERKVLRDPVTGAKLIFLTSKPRGDFKIYQTHPQWTSDEAWIIFRSNRVRGEAMAVNEETGEMVQVTEGGFAGRLNVAPKSMNLYFMRRVGEKTPGPDDGKSSFQVIELDLACLFEDSKAGNMKLSRSYERVCGVTPPGMISGGEMALDANEDWVYLRLSKAAAANHLPPGVEPEDNFGPRNLGAGPGGIARMNIRTGEIMPVVSVPFQVGHIQSNQWNPGEIVFCWETGGKAPQRTWTVMADGSGLRPLYPEEDYEWVTHEAIVTKDEAAMAIMGDRPVVKHEFSLEEWHLDKKDAPLEEPWGPAGSREKPTGLAIVNLRTREMAIAGQIPYGSGFWHVNGSPDGRWAVGDNFSRSVYIIDRHSGEMKMLTTGHKQTAADHPHPSFSPDSKKVLIQSAMRSKDGRSMNLCIIPVPGEWLSRSYDKKFR